MGKPKRVSYHLIRLEDDEGPAMYRLLEDLVTAHHEDLAQARIALAWCTSWRADADGRCTIGRCRKASDLDRELAAFDFVILLLRSFWQDPLVTPLQRRALLDHELCHAAVKYDRAGEPVEDERGRIVYRTRKHDVEEFTAIIDRHGCYKKDLEAFQRAIDRARQRANEQWVGYTSLQLDLKEAGCSVPLDLILEWSDDQRREARTWALLRHEHIPELWRQAIPSFLAHVRSSEL